MAADTASQERGWFAGLRDLFSGKPRQPIGADGRMALGDHVRELRARVLKALLAIIVMFAIAIVFYDQLLTLVQTPFDEARERIKDEVDTELVTNSATAGLLLQLKLCGTAAIIGSSPFWLYQIWAFVLPGLHKKERSWSIIFVAVAGPTFIMGAALGYFVLPKGLEVLIGFNPENVSALIDYQGYFSFLSRMLLVFGLSLEIPLFMVMLNLAGILKGRQIAKARPWIVVGGAVFAGVATPSTDPFSMLALLIPLLTLTLIAEVVARTVDRRRDRRRAADPAGTQRWGDDEISEL